MTSINKNKGMTLGLSIASLGVILLIIAILSSHRDQDRLAYYKCLDLTEKIMEQNENLRKQGSYSIYTLPFCRL